MGKIREMAKHWFAVFLLIAASAFADSEVEELRLEINNLSERLRLAEERAIDLSPVCSGRLTLTSGTAITTSDVTAATAIFYTPHNGNKISLYNGSTWKLFSFSELSLALGTISNNTNYDVFAYDNSGTVALDSPVAWSTDTARATSLVLQDGIYVKSGATTRRYLGTFRTTSTTTTEDSTSKRFLWNMCQRVIRHMKATYATDGWSYSALSWRAINGNTTTGQTRLEFIHGLIQQPLHAEAYMPIASAAATATYAVAIGIGSVTTPSSDFFGSAGSTAYNALYSAYTGHPGLGYNWAQWIENASGTAISLFQNDGGRRLGGMTAQLWG